MTPARATFEGIQEDLKPFTDPGTALAWTADSRNASAEWSSRTQRLSATFSLSRDGTVKVTFQGQQLDYQQFLSHSAVADLLGLANMIDQAYKPEIYVDTKAQVPGQSPEPALALMRRLLSDASDSPATSVVFVSGDAGAGKTSVLRELVRTQARSYRRGEVTVLYLYVNAQGRALARFDEALAISLQDLRAHLTYGALPTLVRNGLVVPVVDGFDELLGVTGYDDAFASLRRFIDDLGGSGEIVASARSTYYEQEFLQRADAVPQSWTLVPVSVLEWGDEEFGQYSSLRFAAEQQNSGTSADFVTALRSCFADPTGRELRGKPFFVATAANLILDSRSPANGQSLLEQFVRAYIERDRTQKLVDPDGAPLLTSEQIEALFVLLAEEMWLQETRELDLSSTREVAQVFLGEQPLPQSTRERVVQRVSKSAFLMSGGTVNRVQFEHETFLAYFLALSVAPACAGGVASSRSMLARGILPPRCADFVVARLEHVDHLVLLERLGEASTTGIQRGGQVRENAGAIVASVLRQTRAEELANASAPIELRGFIFAGLSFAGIDAVNLSFVGTEFRRVDLSRCRILRSVASGVLFFDVIVDPASTRLELSGIEDIGCFVGLRVRGKSEDRHLYELTEIANVLDGVGLHCEQNLRGQVRRVSEAAAEAVQEVMMAFERSNVIWPADDRYARLRNRAAWPDVRRLLVDCQVVGSEIREQRGAQRELLRRRYLPGQVLLGVNRRADVPDAIRRFWDALEAQHQPTYAGAQ